MRDIHEFSGQTGLPLPSPGFSMVQMREWSTDPRTTACIGRSTPFNGTAKLRLSMRQGWQLSKRVNCPPKYQACDHHSAARHAQW